VRAAVDRYRDKVAALDAEAQAGLARLDARVRTQQVTGRRWRR